MTEKGSFGNPPLEWEPLPFMEEYLDELDSLGKSEGYVRSIRKSLAHFSQFCRAEEDVKHHEEIERKHLLRFQAYLNRSDYAKSYRTQLLKYLKGWLRWMKRMGYLDDTPWQDITIGSYGKTPNPISDDALERIFATHRSQAFSMSPFIWHRQEVILTLLYAWGLRISELQALNVANVDTRLDFVTARNKGGSSKTLPYSKDLKAVVTRWLRVRSQNAVMGEDALIISQTGQRLSIDSIRSTITDLGNKAGVNVNPHRLRDTFGTHMLDEDMAVERLSKIMGHSNTKQTLAYSRVNDRKVAEDHERAISKRLQTLLPNLRRTNDYAQGDANG